MNESATYGIREEKHLWRLERVLCWKHNLDLKGTAVVGCIVL